VLGAGLGYSSVFIVSGSMALVALALYTSIFLFMHRRKPVAVAAT
jgi:hypothetical protein